MVWNISLVSWDQLFWLCPPRSFLCMLILLAGGAGQETEKALTLCKLCSEKTKMFQCYQHCSAQIQNTVPYCYYEENYVCPRQKQQAGN